MRSAYAAHNTNPETVRRSSSGGIFSLLAAHVLNEGGRAPRATRTDGSLIAGFPARRRFRNCAARNTCLSRLRR